METEPQSGQVVVAESRSSAFDPALELLDSKNKVLASNDDRYPGDQRPLLFWRCDQAGAYALHVRCFHDKSGGQFVVRFKTYDSIDLSSGQKVEQEIDALSPFLLRIPMKAGQIKELVTDVGGDRNYLSCYYNQTISPTGLPELNNLTIRVQPAFFALMAPVDGDYYIMETANANGPGRARVKIGTREIVSKKLERTGSTVTASAPTNVPALWELDVKAGEFLEASTPDLDINTSFKIADEPDISKFDITKVDANPFYPLPNRPMQGEDPSIDFTAARARDGRILVFRAKRDAKLWIASNGAGAANKQFTLRVKPAAAEFAEDKPTTGKLRIGNTDYWGFDAKSGDVMSFNAATTGFSQVVVVRDPDLAEVRHNEWGPDQTSDSWKMIVQKPGRYLVAVSSLGDGGAGEYSLSRKVFHATEFNKATPASGDISDGQVQIWKFTATPNDPLLIHWNSSRWSYGIAVYDDKGQPADFEHQDIDANNRLGILKVAKPQTFVIVLTGTPERATYSIDLSDIPSFKKTTK